jgi:hypothetical protein
MAAGLDNLIIISDEAFEQVQELMRSQSNIFITQEGKSQIGKNELNFEAYMRWMDSQVISLFVYCICIF